MFFFDIIIMIGACYWDGEAPFCEGKCPEGYDECGRDDCGDGEDDDDDDVDDDDGGDDGDDGDDHD